MDNIHKIILEESLAGHWDWHILANRVYLSPKLKAVFGYEEHELEDFISLWDTIIQPEDKSRLEVHLAECFKSGGKIPFNIDVRYRHKSGSTIWVNTTGRVIEWKGKKPVRMVGCHIDITQRKLDEQQAEIANETLKSAFQYSPIGMVLVSLEGRFMKVNNSICELLGYTEEELLSKTFQEITHPEDLQADLELLDKLLAGEVTTYKMEKRYFTKSGSILWIFLNVSMVVDQARKPLYFVSQIKDITDRKIAEDALRESERRWIFASEGTGGGIWDWDLRTNSVFHSDQCIRMIGFEPHEFDTVPGVWTKRVHPSDREKYVNDVQGYLRGETAMYENQHRVQCKDGSYKWILDRGKVIEYAADGSPARVIGTHTDITEQKQQEEQLRRTLNTVSGQNNRLLNFAYIVSHNLRTHSSNFKMIMDVINDPHTNEREKAEMSAHLLNVSELLNDTINNLNEVVSIQTNIDIQTSEINLRDYFEKAIGLLQNDIKRWNVDIQNNIPAHVNLVYSPAYMESIIFNLISNAIKYRSLTQRPIIIVDYIEADGKPGFSVADNGIGINLEKYGDQLFGMYKTFNGNSDAKGMGLFITKNQVEACGGNITVSSQPSQGTKFTVRLSST
ncbi:PAS domain S-box protein [Mucilaginibacter pallidiroseus]|uniref:histidine kinase n=1 Tax=Mucilaginibacter pallidiroseus TaxID=2599295 RepID=A0A563UE92_9SPHI|nr:PAS domain-containing sensor histidine kinase [Mucilaginibacter pallidiroseus]TWR29668.1 PAS domain S-box protein [Mucilaginibacter pallidiroseus]